MKKKINQKTQKKVNGITEIVFILDKSGSMWGYERDTIGGFNCTIEKQKNEKGKAYVSTVLFDNHVHLLHDRVDIEKLPVMTEKEYHVGGATALLDAIGQTIDHVSKIHKYARLEDVPEHTIFVITTDGMENASKNYSSNKIKQMIQQKTNENGWEFVFLAANIDAVETADMYGICKERAVNYRQDEEGIKESYKMMSSAISNLRNERSLDDEDWKNGGGEK